MFNTAECIAFDGKVEAAVLVAALAKAVGSARRSGPFRAGWRGGLLRLA